MTGSILSDLTDRKDDQGRYGLVDLCRGLAALAVLIWHYQHFYFPEAGAGPAFEGRSVQPFYDFLAPLYHQGLYAVHFFWVISGFVFASVYGGRRVSGRSFALNRFSRLYPLHFITLVCVAALQMISLMILGYEQIYTHTDVYHFVLNLFFISDWGFQEGYSFNAPIWSVSIEIFIYLVFFLTARPLFRFGSLGPVLMTLSFAALLWFKVPGAFWWCGFFFFAGASVWSILIALDRHAKALIGLILGLFALFAWVKFAPPFFVRPEIQFIFLFAGIILLAGFMDRRKWLAGIAGWRWIGDNTYGTYLWHVPVQMMAMIIMDVSGISRDVVSSTFFFLGFLFVVCLLARWSFLTLERPAQTFLRQRFSGAG